MIRHPHPWQMTEVTCECGSPMTWVPRWSWGRGFGFVRLFRQECACGRCGPWRLKPDRKVWYSPSASPVSTDKPKPEPKP